MVFASVAFLFGFLPLCLLAYYASPARWRNTTLLAASLLFYSWGEGWFVAVLLISAFANWAFGLRIDRAETPSRRQLNLALAIGLNLALLFTYKYANFFFENANAMLSALGFATIASSPVQLPIGISFFIFQAMSYLVDVYRRDAPTETNPGRLALYIALFPQLIAGPIVRYRDIAAQLRDREIDIRTFASGVERFILGLGKKVLIANTLAACVDGIFAVPAESWSVELAWAAALAYTLQIYFDFSGYSDMAIGLGRMFGLRFLENFDHPYVARSVTEFWRRWHISLSTWFRDYLYIPLGGNRRSAQRTYANLLVVFLLCGLWHGASWTFVGWGLFHGAFLIVERAGVGARLARLPGALQHVYLLLIVVAGWVLFRAETFDVAATIWAALCGAAPWSSAAHPLGAFVSNEVWAVGIVAVVCATPWPSRVARSWRERTEGRSGFAHAVSVGAWMTLLVLSTSYLVAGTHNPFIYFRF